VAGVGKDAGGLEAGSFYKAASTGENFIFSGNSNNNVFFYQELGVFDGPEDMTYDLSEPGEMSIPAE
jgi:hypothetical protein